MFNIIKYNLQLLVVTSFIMIKLLSASGIYPIKIGLEESLLESKLAIRGKVLRLVVVHVRLNII